MLPSVTTTPRHGARKRRDAKAGSADVGGAQGAQEKQKGMSKVGTETEIKDITHQRLEIS
jgi:hypothetical protein